MVNVTKLELLKKSLIKLTHKLRHNQKHNLAENEINIE